VLRFPSPPLSDISYVVPARCLSVYPSPPNVCRLFSQATLLRLCCHGAYNFFFCVPATSRTAHLRSPPFLGHSAPKTLLPRTLGPHARLPPPWRRQPPVASITAVRRLDDVPIVPGVSPAKRLRGVFTCPAGFRPQRQFRIQVPQVAPKDPLVGMSSL